MLTDKEIQDLIASPKEIVHRSPKKGYREDDGHRRCDMRLDDLSGNSEEFSVFVRQSKEFPENYSIGLRHRLGSDEIKTITLVRYNGPHGEDSRHEDGHYAKPHIHRITSEELKSGSSCPQESHREITEKYRTFEEAIKVFFENIGVGNVPHRFTGYSQTSIFP